MTHEEATLTTGEAPEAVAGDDGMGGIDIGTVVNGRYEAIRPLGSGGLGRVYLVHDKLESKPLALKTLHSYELSAEQLALFKNEFETMARLRHPNLAQVYDFEPLHGTDDHFFTMEFVAGLDAFRATENSSINQVLDIVVQICRALAYIHSRSIIHFDLKPGNIIVSPSGQVKVLDFGIAGAKPRQAAGGGHMGTPTYLAPELALGERSIDHRVDLYSLGIMLYQLLLRRPPFEDDSTAGLLRKHCFESVTFSPGDHAHIPKWLQAIVEQLCAKEPADRYRSANAVIQAINVRGGCNYEIETRQTRESYLLSSRFVARSQDFKRLVAFVEGNLHASAGVRPAAFISGVSGIGKSRLLREARHYLQLSRHHFIEANCYDGALAEFDPIVEAVRRVLAVVESFGNHELLHRHGPELAKISPALARERGVHPAPPAHNPEAERAHIVQSLAHFFLDAAHICPYVLYINDLQWSLAGTAEVLSRLISAIAEGRQRGDEHRLCVLGSYREGEADDRPISDLLRDHQAMGHLLHISLKPLSQKHVGKLLGSMLGVDAPPKRFVERIYAESAGNPFFVEEILRVLVENGTVYLEDGQWAANEDIEAIKIPSTIRAAFLNRYASLPDAHRAIMAFLVTHGQPLSFRLLQHLTGIEMQQLQAILTTLARRQMVIRLATENGAYGPIHDQMREAVYASLDAEQRRRMHRHLANSLAEVYAERKQDVIYELARHSWEAQDTEQALEHSLQAAAQATEEYAYDQGILFYRRALQILTEAEGSATQQWLVLENLGDLLAIKGSYAKAIACYERIIGATDDVLRKARLLRKHGDLLFARGALQEALKKLWRASRLLKGAYPRTRLGFLGALFKNALLHGLHRFAPRLVRSARRTEVRARLTELSAIYLGLTYVYYFVDPIKNVLCVLLATNTCERVGESPQMCKAYSALSVVYGSLARFRGARAYGESAIALGEKLEKPRLVGNACALYGTSLFFMAQLERSRQELERGKAILAETGDIFELELCYIHLSYCYLFQGKYRTALETVQAYMGVVESTDSLQMGKTLLIHAAMARAKLGSWEGVREQMQEAVAMCESMNDLMQLAAFRVFHGDMLLIADAPQQAVESLELARQIREEHRLMQDYPAGVYAYLVRAYVARWEQTGLETSPRTKTVLRRRLRKLSRKAVRICRYMGHPNYLSPSLLSRGLSLWLDQKWTAAKHKFDQAIAIAEDQDAGMWLAEACYEAGRHLIRREATRECGEAYLRRVRALFEAQGYTPYRSRVRRLLHEEQRA